MKNFINSHPIISGAISIIVGLGVFYYTRRNPENPNSIIATNFRGYIGGGAFIVIGIVLLWEYFKRQ